MTAPLSPADVCRIRGSEFAVRFPEVVKAVNGLLTTATPRGGGELVIHQSDVVRLLTYALSGDDPDTDTREAVYNSGRLDFEDAYRRQGWDVVYEKPSYGDTYFAPFWRFTPNPENYPAENVGEVLDNCERQLSE